MAIEPEVFELRRAIVTCLLCALVFAMASAPVSAGPFTKNFGSGEAELWSDENITLDIDDIQDWDFGFQANGGESMYVQVTAKWMDKTTSNDEFNLSYTLDVNVYSQGYPGPIADSDHDEWLIEDESANFLNDRWFSQNLTCGPFPPDASGICVFECWFIGEIENLDQETYDTDLAHWFINCVP